MRAHEQQASEPSAKFLEIIDSEATKELAAVAKAVDTDHRLITTAIHWLVHYGDLFSVKLEEKLAYEVQAVAIARKLDSDPDQIDSIIERYEEREIVRGQYG